MSADTSRIKIPRFSNYSEEQKQVSQENAIFRVLEINWFAERDTPFSSSKTTCNISATSCWVLKTKGTPFKLDSLHFKAHKKLDGSTGLVKIFFTVMLILIAHNMGDKVFDSKGTLFWTEGR